jgi:hypothetical protein
MRCQQLTQSPVPPRSLVKKILVFLAAGDVRIGTGSHTSISEVVHVAFEKAADGLVSAGVPPVRVDGGGALGTAESPHRGSTPPYAHTLSSSCRGDGTRTVGAFARPRRVV